MATISAATSRAPRTHAADAQQQKRRYGRAIKQQADAQAKLALANLLQTGVPSVKQETPSAHQLFKGAAKQRRSAQTLFKLAKANMDNPVSSATAQRAVLPASRVGAPREKRRGAACLRLVALPCAVQKQV